MTGKKYEKAFGLDMPFGEALGRFVRTKPSQLPDREATKSKRKKSLRVTPKHGETQTKETH